MDQLIRVFRQRLAECLTDGAIDRVRDETWDQIQRTDSIRNTIVLNECTARRQALKGEKQSKR